MKLNTDGCSSRNLRRAGCSVVLGNYNGFIVGCFATHLGLDTSVTEEFLGAISAFWIT